jgi:hypothetical protein
VLSSLVLALALLLFVQPRARANRLLRSAGLPPLPASVRDLRIERRGFGTGRGALRFSTSPEAAHAFLRASPVTALDDPVPMAHLRFGRQSPLWMQWGGHVDGRLWHTSRNDASVWLAIDDGSGTIYVAVFETQPPWFRRLLMW